MDYGLALAFAGAAFATFLSGIGSSIGLGISGRSATGILSEKPEQYGLMTLLVVLPSTQGIYGLVISLFVMIKINLFGGDLADLTLAQGLMIFGASLPVGIAGLFSGIHQGKICAGGIQMAAKRPEMGVKAGVVYAAMIEFYAILGFLVSFLLIFIGVTV
ncbi:MAG: V-type ATP synthase subunit K [Phycisphaerae bacterium]|jgi:V/A-type H+-transporting ATPase subunit K|nr:V-type ATP synthase subunit K [Phycisphaerae bacterium]